MEMQAASSSPARPSTTASPSLASLSFPSTNIAISPSNSGPRLRHKTKPTKEKLPFLASASPAKPKARPSAGTAQIPVNLLWIALAVFVMVPLLVLAIMMTRYRHSVVPCAPPPSCPALSVFVGIMTGQAYLRTRADVSNTTWVPYARALGVNVRFFAPTSDETLPDLIALAQEGEDPLVYEGTAFKGGNKRTFAMLRWAVEAFPEQRWFLRVEDDTFVHAGYLLSDVVCRRDPSQPMLISFLHHKQAVGRATQGYGSGGAGYLMSRPAVEAMLQARDRGQCENQAIEAVTVSACMHELGIPVKHSALFHERVTRKWWTVSRAPYVSYHGLQARDKYLLDQVSFPHC